MPCFRCVPCGAGRALRAVALSPLVLCWHAGAGHRLQGHAPQAHLGVHREGCRPGMGCRRRGVCPLRVVPGAGHASGAAGATAHHAELRQACPLHAPAGPRVWQGQHVCILLPPRCRPVRCEWVVSVSLCLSVSVCVWVCVCVGVSVCACAVLRACVLRRHAFTDLGRIYHRRCTRGTWNAGCTATSSQATWVSTLLAGCSCLTWGLQCSCRSTSSRSAWVVRWAPTGTWRPKWKTPPAATRSATRLMCTARAHPCCNYFEGCRRYWRKLWGGALRAPRWCSRVGACRL